MKSAKWTCSVCGMSSGRKWSVQRHLENYNFHSGKGSVITFVQYAVGIREGKNHEHQTSELSPAKSHRFFDEILTKISMELERLIAKDVASKIFQDMSKDQTQLKHLQKLAEAYIVNKNYYKSIKELAGS